MRVPTRVMQRVAAASMALLVSQPAFPVEDVAAVGRCVLTQCSLPVASCVVNPKCLANLACIQTCNGRKDETECQIRCGDLFENAVVGKFNECAVSQKKCVPQRQDDGSYPIPSSFVKNFDTSVFEGRWFISAGLNPLFDTFDCQVHFFTSLPGKLYGKLNWRIEEPDGEFFTKDTIQKFVQDPQMPGVLYNHDNEYLHYQDDWYILDYDSDFVLVYYRGTNDAWDGYGGAVLYTRTPVASDAVKGRAAAACAKAGLDFSKFIEPDNSCPDELRTTQALLLKEKYASRVFLTAEKELQEEATSLRKNAVGTFNSDVKEVIQATAKLERAVADYERVIEKDIVSVENSILKKLQRK